MTGQAVDFAAIDDLVAALREPAPGPALRADVDPALLSPPCVWVNLQGFSDDTLGCLAYRLELVLIVPDQDHRRAMTALAGVYNKVITVLDPTGETTTQGTVLPGAPTPLPSLAVPFTLLAS